MGDIKKHLYWVKKMSVTSAIENFKKAQEQTLASFAKGAGLDRASKSQQKNPEAINRDKAANETAAKAGEYQSAVAKEDTDQAVRRTGVDVSGLERCPKDSDQRQANSKEFYRIKKELLGPQHNPYKGKFFKYLEENPSIDLMGADGEKQLHQFLVWAQEHTQFAVLNPKQQTELITEFLGTLHYGPLTEDQSKKLDSLIKLAKTKLKKDLSGKKKVSKKLSVACAKRVERAGKDPKKLSRARETAQASLEQDPTNAQAYLSLAAISYKEGKAEVGRSNLEKAIMFSQSQATLDQALSLAANDPQIKDPKIFAADALNKAERFEEAAKLLPPSYESPASPEAKQIYTQLTKSFKIEPKHLDANQDQKISDQEVYAYVSEHMDQEFVAMALIDSGVLPEKYYKGKQLDGDFVKQVKYSGFGAKMAGYHHFISKQVKDDAEKERHIRTALRYEPSNLYYRVLGNHLKSIDPDAAKQTFQKALEKDPTDPVSKIEIRKLEEATDPIKTKFLIVESLLGEKKLKAAKKLLREMEKDYGKINLSKVAARQFKARFYMLKARYFELKGNKKKAARNYQISERNATAALWKQEGDQRIAVEDPETYLILAKYRLSQGDLKKALDNFEWAGKLSESYWPELLAFKADLREREQAYEAARLKAQAESNQEQELAALAKQIEILELLKHYSKIERLKKEYDPNLKKAALEKAMEPAQKLAKDGYLNWDNLGGKGASLAVYIESIDADSKKPIKFSQKFFESPDAKKAEILQEMSRVGQIAQNQKLSRDEKRKAERASQKAAQAQSEAEQLMAQGAVVEHGFKDSEARAYIDQAYDHETKAIYYQQRVLLLEGRMEEAKLKMIEIKSRTEPSQDPEIIKIRKEIQAQLREFNLAHIKRVDTYNQQIAAQRALRPEHAHAHPQSLANETGLLLMHYEDWIKDPNNNVDTLEEAPAYLDQENQKLIEKFYKNPVVRSDWRVRIHDRSAKHNTEAFKKQKALADQVTKDYEFNPQDPNLFKPQAYQGLNYIKVEAGGAIKIGRFATFARIIVGRASQSEKPEYIYVDTAYGVRRVKCDPTRELLILIDKDGRFRTEAESRLIEPRVYERIQLRNYDYRSGHPNSLEDLVEHEKKLKDKDNLVWSLRNLESAEMYEKMKTKEGKRNELLKLARNELRARGGSYQVAGEVFKGIFAASLERAKQKVSKDKIQKIVKKVEKERGKVTKQTREAFHVRLKQGIMSEAELLAVVDLKLEGRVQEEIEKAAFSIMQKDYEKCYQENSPSLWGQQKPEDRIIYIPPEPDNVFYGLSENLPVWSEFEDMMDTQDDFWNWSDATVDQVIDEVAFAVATAPITGGLGSITRAGLVGGSKYILKGASLNFVKSWLKVQAAGVFMESLGDELLRAGIFNTEFSWQNVGYGMVTFGLNRTVGGAMTKGLTKAGIGEGVATVTGNVLGGATVATGFDVLRGADPLESFAGHLARNTTFLFVNQVTNKPFDNMDKLAMAQLRQARETGKIARNLGLSREQAKVFGYAEAQGLDIDNAGNVVRDPREATRAYREEVLPNAGIRDQSSALRNEVPSVNRALHHDEEADTIVEDVRSTSEFIAGDRLTLSPDMDYILGRRKSEDANGHFIPIEGNNNVSGTHLGVRVEENGIRITDLGSTEGTWIFDNSASGGWRRVGGALIQPGQQFALGGKPPLGVVMEYGSDGKLRIVSGIDVEESVGPRREDTDAVEMEDGPIRVERENRSREDDVTNVRSRTESDIDEGEATTQRRTHSDEDDVTGQHQASGRSSESVATFRPERETTNYTSHTTGDRGTGLASADEVSVRLVNAENQETGRARLLNHLEGFDETHPDVPKLTPINISRNSNAQAGDFLVVTMVDEQGKQYFIQMTRGQAHNLNIPLAEEYYARQGDGTSNRIPPVFLLAPEISPKQKPDDYKPVFLEQDSEAQVLGWNELRHIHPSVDDKHMTVYKDGDHWYVMDGYRDANGVIHRSKHGLYLRDGQRVQRVRVVDEDILYTKDDDGKLIPMFKLNILDDSYGEDKTKQLRVNEDDTKIDAQFEDDFRSFHEGNAKLIGPVKGIDAELNNTFAEGGWVYKEGSQYKLMERPGSAREVIFAKTVDKSVYDAYLKWVKVNGFGEVRHRTAKFAWDEIQGTAKEKEIRITWVDESGRETTQLSRADLERYGGQIAYINKILKLLPAQFFINGNIKEIKFNSAMVGNASGSAYYIEGGALYLYAGILQGARFNLLGTLLHELGHSNNLHYKNDEDMKQYWETIAHETKTVFGIDWVDGSEGRINYQTKAFDTGKKTEDGTPVETNPYSEFLAETSMAYILAGPQLRMHIAALPLNSKARKAWEYVYNQLKDEFFGGREYGKEVEESLPRRNPTRLQRVRPQGTARPPAVSRPDRVKFETVALGERSEVSIPKSQGIDLYLNQADWTPASSQPSLLVNDLTPTSQSPRENQPVAHLQRNESGELQIEVHNNSKVKVFQSKSDNIEVQASPDNSGSKTITLREGYIVEIGFTKFVYDAKSGELRIDDVIGNDPKLFIPQQPGQTTRRQPTRPARSRPSLSPRPSRYRPQPRPAAR